MIWLCLATASVIVAVVIAGRAHSRYLDRLDDLHAQGFLNSQGVLNNQGFLDNQDFFNHQ